jgi:hypothetical protein
LQARARAAMQQDRPKRIVGLFTARPMQLEEIPRLVDFCSKAYAEETPGASLKLLPSPPGTNVFRLEVIPGALLRESEVVLRVHKMDDPDSDHERILEHLEQLDQEIGMMGREAVKGAEAFLAVVGTRLLEQGRIRAFLNAASLIGSALGAMFVDPTAVMITPEPAEWIEAAEQSLAIEGAMAAQHGIR